MVELIIKWAIAIFYLCVALIPTGLFFLIKNFTNPDGFWQQIAIYGIGSYFLGGLQIVLLILWIHGVVNNLFD